jgi:TonB family protein
LTLLLLTAAAPTLAQFSTAPVLTAPPNVNYPPIAKAAHVSGDVTVTFAINPDGTTTSVQVVSGPEMLRDAVAEPIRHWRFKTPLPLNAQTYFEAKYAFRIKTNEDEGTEDSLDTPPYSPCCGDMITIRASGITLSGDVHSVDGSETIDLIPASISKAEDRCPKDTYKQPSDKADFSDYVELFRYNCDEGCPTYRVRVYRNGRISWRGFNDVVAKGDREALIASSAADALVTSFQSEQFWSACSVASPPDPRPKPKLQPSEKPARDDDNSSDTIATEEEATGVYLTASIGGITKTLNAWQYSFPDSEVGQIYAWAIDRAADTHRWRHPDPATEPYDNMYDDLETPKPGITLLIRATNHFNPYTGQQTFTYLDKLLKRGEPVNAADASGWTALMYASYLDPIHYDAAQPDPIKLLLYAHADPNIASLHGDTALMFAAYHGTFLQPLIDHGANINAHNADGVTPLMLLAQKPDPDEIKDALAAGADPNAHDNLGRTAFDYLRAASCDKPIIPFPQSRGGMVLSTVRTGPPPCPSNTPKFLQSQSLLQAAMKAAARPHQ